MTVYEEDFQSRSTLYLALMALILLTPFSVNNFAQGELNLGAGSLAIITVLAVNAWTINHGRHYPLLTLYVLIPLIIIYLSMAIQKQAIIGALWCYPSVIVFYFILPERKAWISNSILLIITFPLIWHMIESPVAIRTMTTLVAVSTFSAIFLRIITNQQKQMHTLAVTDPLTGVHNRTMLHTTLSQAQQQGNRTGSPMTLVSLDLDHFKKINDTFGHDTGDVVLKAIGEYLGNTIRVTDDVFRMGGEEFLVLLYGTDKVGGHQFAEKLRTDIAELALLPERPITVSIGVATLLPDETRDQWVRRCDDYLYRAKSAGRNQIVS